MATITEAELDTAPHGMYVLPGREHREYYDPMNDRMIEGFCMEIVNIVPPPPRPWGGLRAYKRPDGFMVVRQWILDETTDFWARLIGDVVLFGGIGLALSSLGFVPAICSSLLTFLASAITAVAIHARDIVDLWARRPRPRKPQRFGLRIETDNLAILTPWIYFEASHGSHDGTIDAYWWGIRARWSPEPRKHLAPISWRRHWRWEFRPERPWELGTI